MGTNCNKQDVGRAPQRVERWWTAFEKMKKKDGIFFVYIVTMDMQTMKVSDTRDLIPASSRTPPGS